MVDKANPADAHKSRSFLTLPQYALCFFLHPTRSHYPARSSALPSPAPGFRLSPPEWRRGIRAITRQP